jgi:nucleoid-associated protein YgaU
MTLVKASLRTNTGESLTCAFNPTEYTISKSASWRGTPTTAAPTAPTPEFVGTKPRNMSLKLLFDAWATGVNVGSAVDTLIDWTNPTQSSISQGTPNPPIVAFNWGMNSFFDAYLSSVSAQYQMFRPDGTPTRATVTVTLIEVPNEPARQNPTSGGMLAGTRTALVTDGETLHSIAYREYGNASLWRALARANRIDDPMRIALGSTLMVPPREEATRLA